MNSLIIADGVGVGGLIPCFCARNGCRVGVVLFFVLLICDAPHDISPPGESARLRAGRQGRGHIILQVSPMKLQSRPFLPLDQYFEFAACHLALGDYQRLQVGAAMANWR
jgi:hypothetical protein